jgi:hypothetical protein
MITGGLVVLSSAIVFAAGVLGESGAISQDMPGIAALLGFLGGVGGAVMIVIDYVRSWQKRPADR